MATIATDLEKNPVGIPWIHTTDDWGRPWCDAASDFYDRLDDQRQHLARHGLPADQMDFAVGTEHALQKVFRTKLWFRGDMSGSVRLQAARGEYESFQLVVCPIADEERTLTKLSDEKTQGNGTLKAKTVTIRSVEVSDLRHAETSYQIDAGHIQIYNVGYIKTVSAQYPTMHVGAWPDPLLPSEVFEVANPNCQPVWVEVKVPEDAPAGNYRGQVVVSGPHDVRIDINLEVWDFSLPKPPSMSMGWSLHGWFAKDGVDKLLERLTVLLEHRLAPWHAAYPHHTKPEDHDRIMSFLLDRGVNVQFTSEKPTAAFVEHLRKKDWLKHYVCVWGDEPHERDYDEYRSRTEQVHEAFPGLAVGMTETPTPDNAGLFDVWIPEPTTQNDAWVQDALRRGDRVWWYLCQLPIHARYHGPIHACPGMVVDRPAIDHRITYWLAFKQGIEGVAYWAISSWPPDFERWPDDPWPPNPLAKFPYSGQHNANGFLCYPGTDGLPWPSIRLKCIRDGLEDYDYLRLLRELSNEAPRDSSRRLLDLPPELAMGLRYYNKDPNVLIRMREKVAREIVELSRK